MLEPLFNKQSELVGWMEPEHHIFGKSLNWVAFISAGHAWCAITGNWAGPVENGLCLDQAGRVIAWNSEAAIPGTAQPVQPPRAVRVERPAKPARPTRPVRSARPEIPMDRWSPLSFIQWVNQ